LNYIQIEEIQNNKKDVDDADEDAYDD